MPKTSAVDILRYIVAGVSEDITHKKALAGAGKWNDIEYPKKKKKEQPKPGTPPRMALSPKRAIDIKNRVAETKKAIAL